LTERAENSGTLFKKHAEIPQLRKVYGPFTQSLRDVYGNLVRRIHKASVNLAESTEGFRKFYGTTHSSVGVRSVIKKIYHS